MGPFVDAQNENVSSGDICFKNAADELEFLDYDDLFMKVFEYIGAELATMNLKTKVVVVPSAREIHHIRPLP